MYKFVVTRCGSERQRGYEGHGREGGGETMEREGEAGQRLGDGGKDTEESFNCPIGLECNR